MYLINVDGMTESEFKEFVQNMYSMMFTLSIWFVSFLVLIVVIFVAYIIVSNKRIQYLESKLKNLK